MNVIVCSKISLCSLSKIFNNEMRRYFMLAPSRSFVVYILIYKDRILIYVCRIYFSLGYFVVHYQNKSGLFFMFNLWSLFVLILNKINTLLFCNEFLDPFCLVLGILLLQGFHFIPFSKESIFTLCWRW